MLQISLNSFLAQSGIESGAQNSRAKAAGA
jgi:hypothetical protein